MRTSRIGVVGDQAAQALASGDRNGTARQSVAITAEIMLRYPEALEAVAAAGFDLVFAPEIDVGSSPSKLVTTLGEAWAVLAGTEGYGRDVLAALPQLRAIARCGVGYDSIDLAAATRHGIAVTICSGANTDAVAEYTVALILAAMKRLVSTDRAVRAGRWRDTNLGHDVLGATVGVIGLGAIGRGVVRRMAGWGCSFLAVEPRPDRDFVDKHAVKIVGLEELLASADVVTLHLPGDKARFLIGERELSLMRPGAILVNTARGSIIDETALVRSIEAGDLASAALDVFLREPLPLDSPLSRLPATILSPHVSGVTMGAARRMGNAIAKDLADLSAGRLPRGLVNADLALEAPLR